MPRRYAIAKIKLLKESFMSEPESNNSSEEKYIVYTEPELEPIIPDFISNRFKDIEQIREALAHQDFATIARIAHIWKGVGSGYGFDYVSELGSEMGKAAHAAQADEIARHLESLAHYLEHVEVVYTE